MRCGVHGFGLGVVLVLGACAPRLRTTPTRPPVTEATFVGFVDLATERSCSQTTLSTTVRGSMRLTVGADQAVRAFYDVTVEETSLVGAFDDTPDAPLAVPTVVSRQSRIAFTGRFEGADAARRLTLQRVVTLDGFETSVDQRVGPDWTFACRTVAPGEASLSIPTPAALLVCVPAGDASPPALAVQGVVAEAAVVFGQGPGVRVRGRVVWDPGFGDGFLALDLVVP